MDCVCLDQHAFEIQLAEQLPQHRPLVVFAGGVADLAVTIRHLRSSTPHRGPPNTRSSLARSCHHTPADRDSLHHTGSGRSFSHESQCTELPHPPVGRSSGTRNPMVATATPGRVPRSGLYGDRMAKRSRSRKLWLLLGIPSTASIRRYQAGKRTPRRIRASGIGLR